MAFAGEVITPASVKVPVPPVPVTAGAVPIWVHAPPLIERSMMKSASLVALSRQVSLTCGPAMSVAARVLGAAGALTEGTRMTAVFEATEGPTGFTAAT